MVAPLEGCTQLAAHKWGSNLERLCTQPKPQAEPCCSQSHPPAHALLMHYSCTTRPHVSSVFDKAQIQPSTVKCDHIAVHYDSVPGVHMGHILALKKTVHVPDRRCACSPDASTVEFLILRDAYLQLVRSMSQSCPRMSGRRSLLFGKSSRYHPSHSTLKMLYGHLTHDDPNPKRHRIWIWGLQMHVQTSIHQVMR
jgi:hypothetical protein